MPRSVTRTVCPISFCSRIEASDVVPSGLNKIGFDHASSLASTAAVRRLDSTRRSGHRQKSHCRAVEAERVAGDRGLSVRRRYYPAEERCFRASLTYRTPPTEIAHPSVRSETLGLGRIAWRSADRASVHRGEYPSRRSNARVKTSCSGRASKPMRRSPTTRARGSLRQASTRWAEPAGRRAATNIVRVRARYSQLPISSSVPSWPSGPTDHTSNVSGLCLPGATNR